MRFEAGVTRYLNDFKKHDACISFLNFSLFKTSSSFSHPQVSLSNHNHNITNSIQSKKRFWSLYIILGLGVHLKMTTNSPFRFCLSLKKKVIDYKQKMTNRIEMTNTFFFMFFFFIGRDNPSHIFREILCILLMTW